ncbi:MAG TPA: hypothetical protein PK098_10120, partial [Phycisphaerales bacterium]|nr:hypothetical protein [Phycisphaerales bacterium]
MTGPGPGETLRQLTREELRTLPAWAAAAIAIRCARRVQPLIAPSAFGSRTTDANAARHVMAIDAALDTSSMLIAGIDTAAYAAANAANAAANAANAADAATAANAANA